MPNRRKPTELLIAQGAYAKNPQRFASRADTPMGEGELGDAPANLSEPEREAWARLKAGLQDGVAFSGDRAAFELLCKIDVKVKTADVKASMITQYIKLLGLFDMTPADRSRVKAISKASPMNKEESFTSLRRMR